MISVFSEPPRLSILRVLRVLLGIARAIELPDPEGLLEGTGKLHRHIKFRQTADLKRSGVRQLLVAAVAAWRQRVDGAAAKRVQPASRRRAGRRS
jgi:hypothetical protein